MSMLHKVQAVDDNGVRAGTARRPGGRRTAARILRAAHELLMTGDHAAFSMRSVAERAGMRLGNLQYYYPRREDLVRALLEYVGEVYNQRYEALLAAAPNDPVARFEAVIRWNFADVGSCETRHFFIQLWALLSETDNYSGELLAQLYQPQLARLQRLVLELSPGLDPAEAQLRAEIIAAMIEGFTVQAPASSQLAQRLEPLRELTVKTALQVARGDTIEAGPP